MIVRKLRDEEVLATTYRANGGGIVQMILDRRVLKEIGFWPLSSLSPGNNSRLTATPWKRPILS